MACEDYLSREGAKDLKLNADYINKTVESDENYEDTPSGQSKITISGIGALAEEQRINIQNVADQQFSDIENTFTDQFLFKKIGDISDFVGDELDDSERLNAYQYPDQSNNWYAPIQSQEFPITIPADPISAGGWAAISTEVPFATEDVAGIAKIATQDDVNNGTNSDKIVTPSLLKHKLKIGEAEKEIVGDKQVDFSLDDIGAVSKEDTGIGKTGNQATTLITTNQAWADLPVGYAGGIGRDSIGLPVVETSYFHKIANRSVNGGWLGMLVTVTDEVYFIYLESTNDLTPSAWSRMYSSADNNIGTGAENYAPGNILDARTRTRVDVSADREFNTDYTNETDYEMEVEIQAEGTGLSQGALLTLRINQFGGGVIDYGDIDSVNDTAFLKGIVMPGDTYQLTVTLVGSGTVNALVWNEIKAPVQVQTPSEPEEGASTQDGDLS